jgi:CheY-like chemotaxis protein
MRISSRPNFGTNVEILLPIAKATGESEPKPSAQPSEGKSDRILRVLIVDDDPNVSAGTVAMIEDLGHVASSAAIALESWRSRPDIDFVIADYFLGETTGTELARDLRKMRPGLPVIIATGYARQNEEILKFPRLDKPYRRRQLSTMKEIDSGRPWLRVSN